MIKLNFLVNHMAASQLSYYITKEINTLIEKRQDVSCIVFFHTISRHAMMPRFAMMQMTNAWHQDGYAIATSMITARRMQIFPGPQHRFYYVWDLEWLRGPEPAYQTYANVIRDPSITLITRNLHHASMIRNNFNVPLPAVVEDFDCNKMLEVITSERINRGDSAA
jgi:hypothetical protein